MIQEIPYAGWRRNLRLRGKTTELVITLDVGPRVIRYAHHGAKNVFVEMPEQLGGTWEPEWMIRGGHRFWTAPEGAHSYAPDNGPVTYQVLKGHGVEIDQWPSDQHGFHKMLRVELLDDEVVRVTHILTNISDRPLEITPWALSVMAPGGTALIPMPPLDLHPSEFPEGREAKPHEFLPNREFVLWPFTNLTDGRFNFSRHFLRVSTHPDLPATKLGVKFPTGWVAYQNGEYVFAKHFFHEPHLTYPDRGCNFEVFTNHAILELESLAPLSLLPPGATRDLVEHWVLIKTDADLRSEKAAKSFFSSLPTIP